MPMTITFTPGKVQKEDGRWFVTCRCGKEQNLSLWAIAHLGEVEMSAVCRGCGRGLTLKQR